MHKFTVNRISLTHHTDMKDRTSKVRGNTGMHKYWHAQPCRDAPTSVIHRQCFSRTKYVDRQYSETCL